MANSVDKILFEDLAEKNPEDVCRRALCEYDKDKKCYTVFAWGDEYKIYPGEYKIDRISNNPEPPHKYFNVFLVNYLLQSKDVRIYNEWISEKDIPGGMNFFSGPHEIPTNQITKRFGDDVESFKKHCEKLDGTLFDMADAAYIFRITPRIKVAVLYWRGDEDFPAEAKLLYDKSITDQLASDIILAVAVDVCWRVSGNNS
ncbi:MAG: DUF3786 domain-containing protein [Desulfobacterium sp.]|nr:DUF3786 domain-containing protein [Desulfobacterium sp.]